MGGRGIRDESLVISITPAVPFPAQGPRRSTTIDTREAASCIGRPQAMVRLELGAVNSGLKTSQRRDGWANDITRPRPCLLLLSSMWPRAVFVDLEYECKLAMSTSPQPASNGSLFLSPPPSYPPLATFLTGHPNPREPPQASRQAPIRFASPHLFRDILSSVTDPNSQRQLPGPRSSLAMSEETFAGAIRRASRAVANAEEAFQSRAGHNADNFIDLTRSPPSPPHLTSEVAGRTSRTRNGGADADFISITTHPHDTSHHSRPRLSSSIDQPVYGPRPPTFPDTSGFFTGFTPADPNDSLTRARNRRAQAFQAQARIPSPGSLIGNYQSGVFRRDEQVAIRRQRENHENWLRTQARTRRIQEDLQREQPSDSASEPDLSLSSGQTTPSATMSPKSQPEAIDLTAVEDNEGLREVLAKQREDAIMSQRPAGATEAGRTTFSAFKCPICMDNLHFATVTKCGHMFCHKCIVDTLKWSTDRHLQDNPGSKRQSGQCPVCRTSISLKEGRGVGRTLVPLRMMKLSLKRKLLDQKGKGKAVEREAEDPHKRKKRKMEAARVKRSGSSSRKRSGTEELFGEFTNDDYASGLVAP